MLDRSLPVPPGLVGPDGAPSPLRFAVYRNNVVAGLTDALTESFPAVRRLVGDEFFRAMARAHVVIDPPRSPILLEYGGGFPDFIARFEPAATVPYLADVARIEWAWVEAYHARDAKPLGAAAFACIDADQRSHVRLEVHPSLRIVRSPSPALTIWRMNVGDGVPRPVDVTQGGEDALIMRPEAEVEVRPMPPGGADFAAAIAEGKSVIESTLAATAADRRFDLQQNLAWLIGAGAFVAYRTGA